MGSFLPVQAQNVNNQLLYPAVPPCHGSHESNMRLHRVIDQEPAALYRCDDLYRFHRPLLFWNQS
jgi:hypothetical protein